MMSRQQLVLWRRGSWRSSLHPIDQSKTGLGIVALHVGTARHNLYKKKASNSLADSFDEHTH